MKAEFGTEISDQVIFAQPIGTASRNLIIMIGIVSCQHTVEIANEHLIFRRIQQALFVYAFQERLRTLASRLPQSRMQTCEQRTGRTMPAIPEIVG